MTALGLTTEPMARGERYARGIHLSVREALDERVHSVEHRVGCCGPLRDLLGENFAQPGGCLDGER